MAEFFKTLASSRERRLRLWNIQVQECEYSFVGTFGARERAFLARPSLDHREVRRLLGHTKLNCLPIPESGFFCLNLFLCELGFGQRLKIRANSFWHIDDRDFASRGRRLGHCVCRSRTVHVGYQRVECAVIQHNIHHWPAFRRTADGNALDLKLAEAKPRPLVSVDEAGAPDEHLREVAVLETCRQR